MTIHPLLVGSVLVVLAVAVLGCSTVVYRHTIDVVISDPARRLGPPPHDVSIFDRQMGSTEDWARKSMGPTSDAAPYRVPYTSTSVATFFDPPRPRKVELALAVPSLEPRGFFAVAVSPGPTRSGQQAAAFVPYGDYFPAKQGPKVTVQYTATPDPHGWHLVLRLIVPPGP